MFNLSVVQNKNIIWENLIPFGFAKDGENYVYSEDIINGQLRMAVRISSDGEVHAAVYDINTEDEYILHLTTDAVGVFVGKVRTAYDNILQRIADSCFECTIFKTRTASEVMRYIRERYGDEFEFLWKTSPENAIVRRADNQKWYAALLTVKENRIKSGGENKIEVIDLRMRTEDIAELVDGQKYYPGYHMNKKHWVTICLDGSVSLAEICRRIDESYLLADK